MKQGKLYEQQRAYGAVRNALWSGRLKRPKECSLCDKKCEPIAHHEDYSKTLEVMWVCNKCHRGLHSELFRKDRVRRRQILQSIAKRHIFSDINVVVASI